MKNLCQENIFGRRKACLKARSRHFDILLWN
jgi:hypothetical protein